MPFDLALVGAGQARAQGGKLACDAVEHAPAARRLPRQDCRIGADVAEDLVERDLRVVVGRDRLAGRAVRDARPERSGGALHRKVERLELAHRPDLAGDVLVDGDSAWPAAARSAHAGFELVARQEFGSGQHAADAETVRVAVALHRAGHVEVRDDDDVVLVRRERLQGLAELKGRPRAGRLPSLGDGAVRREDDDEALERRRVGRVRVVVEVGQERQRQRGAGGRRAKEHPARKVPPHWPPPSAARNRKASLVAIKTGISRMSCVESAKLFLSAAIVH